MDIVSIVLGVTALATAFTPFIWLQVVGGFAGIAGIVLARKAYLARQRRPTTARASPPPSACSARSRGRCCASWHPCSRS